MTTYITAVRLSPPSSQQHEHITDVQWQQPGESGHCTRQVMVEFIRQGNVVAVHGNPDARVMVVDVNPPYLRTYADGQWSNNLLALPRF